MDEIGIFTGWFPKWGLKAVLICFEGPCFGGLVFSLPFKNRGHGWVLGTYIATMGSVMGNISNLP